MYPRTEILLFQALCERRHYTQMALHKCGLYRSSQKHTHKFLLERAAAKSAASDNSHFLILQIIFHFLSKLIPTLYTFYCIYSIIRFTFSSIDLVPSIRITGHFNDLTHSSTMFSDLDSAKWKNFSSRSYKSPPDNILLPNFWKERFLTRCTRISFGTSSNIAYAGSKPWKARSRHHQSEYTCP